MPVTFIHVLLFATTMGQSIFYVSIAWLVLNMTGTIASVGLLLVWRPVLSLTIGPFLGALVDRHNRSNVLVWGQALIVIGIGWLLLDLNAHPFNRTSLAAITAAACLVFLGSLLSAPSAQGLLQSIGRKSLRRTVSAAIATIQVGDILGVLIGGLTVGFLGFEWSFALSAAAAAVSGAFAMALHRLGDTASDHDRTGYFAATGDGLRLVLRNHRLLISCLAVALTWSMSQFTIALLAPFTYVELGLGPAAYGWIDAMWGVGAFIASFLLSWSVAPHLIQAVLTIGLPALAVTTIIFSTAQHLWSAMLLHGLMGFAFGLNRTVYDIYILATVGNKMIGRVRNNVEALVGVGGIITFLSPALYAERSVRAVYIGYALVLLILAGLLSIWRYLLAEPENLDSLT